MNEYIVTWNETVAYRTTVSASSNHEAITVVKDGSQPCDVKSIWTEWDDDSFVAISKCRCGAITGDNGMLCWRCEEVEDQRQVDQA